MTKNETRVLRRIVSQPGIDAKYIPLNQRSALRSLEKAGYIVYQEGRGWYPTKLGETVADQL